MIATMNRFEGPSPALPPAPRDRSERCAQRLSGQAAGAFKRITKRLLPNTPSGLAQYASEPRTAVRRLNELSPYHSPGWGVLIRNASARPARLEGAKAKP
jgi:hypothetical protein